MGGDLSSLEQNVVDAELLIPLVLQPELGPVAFLGLVANFHHPGIGGHIFQETATGSGRVKVVENGTPTVPRVAV